VCTLTSDAACDSPPASGVRSAWGRVQRPQRRNCDARGTVWVLTKQRAAQSVRVSGARPHCCGRCAGFG